MKSKKMIAAAVMLIVTVLITSRAHALIPVVDAGSIAQQIIQYSTQLSQYATQVQQYQNQIRQLTNQYQQLRNEAQNLQNLNWQAPLTGLTTVGQIMQSANGIAASYAAAQNQFQRLYPDFNGYTKMKGPAYVSQATAWQQQNRNAALDTMKVQAMLRDAFQADQSTLNEASNRSAGAYGTRDALQATNQLLAVVSKQLMQLQQLLSSTAALDAGYAAERASKEAAAQQRNQERFSGWTDKGTRTVRTGWGSLH